jgi:hypothetical protein
MSGWEGWGGFETRKRVPVAGGVAVGKPGKVHGTNAVDLVEAAEWNATSGIATRARRYARQGQVVGVDIADRTATAQVQGTEADPYLVSIHRQPNGRLIGACDCPYGCGAYGWCKHAVALAYVVAHIIDHDPLASARWTGAAAVPVDLVAVPATVVERLQRPVEPVEVIEPLLAAAADVALPPDSR